MYIIVTLGGFILYICGMKMKKGKFGRSGRPAKLFNALKINVVVEENTWKLFQIHYPRQASKMIDKFLLEKVKEKLVPGYKGEY